MASELGEPLPRFSDDDVLDFVVKEAMLTRIAQSKEKAEQEAERKAWRKNHRKMRKGGGPRV